MTTPDPQTRADSPARPAPDCAIITCRNRNGGETYVARALRCGVSASSTMGRRVAIERCAAKIYGPDGFKLHQYTPETWVASPQEDRQCAP